MAMTTKVIAEIGMSHGWDFVNALVYIRMAAISGADIVKFQCHRGNPMKDVPDFTESQWRSLRQEADLNQVGFLVSPFSLEAAQMLDPMVYAWKVASGQVTNLPMLDFMNETGKPVLVSRGLGTFLEFEEAAAHLKDVELTWMTCESAYPTPPGQWQEPDPGYGYSDHSGTFFPGLWAAIHRCPFVEVHVKDDDSVGNDLAASITYEELSYLTHGIKMLQTPKAPKGASPEMRSKYLWK